MSLACSSSATAHYFTVTSSNHRRARRTTPTGATSGTSSGDERWVALNKDTFLNILNEILSQPAISTYIGGRHTPEVTSHAHFTYTSPTYDRQSKSRRSSAVDWYDAGTFGLRRFGGDTKSACCDECGQSSEYERVKSSERIHVDGTSRLTCFSCAQRSSADAQWTGVGDCASTETATDLTMVDRRRPPPGCSPEPSIGSTDDQVGETAAVYQSQRDQHVGFPSAGDSPSTGGNDGREATKHERLPHVDDFDNDFHRHSVTSSSPDCPSTASTTIIANQSPSSCSSEASDRRSISGTNAEIGPRASWMAIDKTLLCDVVNRMLYRDIVFGFRNCHDSAFPFPVDSCPIGRSPGKRSCSPEITTGSTRCWRDDENELRGLPCPSSFVTEPEIPQRSLVTSLLREHPVAGSDSRLQKRTTYGVADLSSLKRRCHERDRVNVLPLPLYLETRNDNMQLSYGDQEAPTNTAHSPSLKWKSTMLLRMRRETSTSGNMSQSSAFT